MGRVKVPKWPVKMKDIVDRKVKLQNGKDLIQRYRTRSKGTGQKDGMGSVKVPKWHDNMKDILDTKVKLQNLMDSEQEAGKKDGMGSI